MSPYSVRPAVVADAEALGRIRAEGWRRAYPGVVAREVLDGLDPEAEAARFAARLHADGVRVAVAVSDDGSVVAYCIYGADRDEPAPGRGEVYALYVDPVQWRTGAGAALLDASVADLGGDGVLEVRLWTLTANGDARAFYERRGWTFDGAERELPTLPAPDGTPVREVRYVRVAPTG